MLLNTCVKSPSRGDGRNESFGVRINERTRFQSTRPSWGATSTLYQSSNFHRFQSTRPSWGATIHYMYTYWGILISIHAPLAGRDGKSPDVLAECAISIHAPLAGRDRTCHSLRALPVDFNPRAPRGARLMDIGGTVVGCVISIHAPLAGRDRPHRACQALDRNFNPRAPRGARRA